MGLERTTAWAQHGRVVATPDAVVGRALDHMVESGELSPAG